MKIGLFIPCYIDQFYPEVGIASLHLLQKLGCEVEYPLNQTCCGQPMSNSGYANLAGGCDQNFAKNFNNHEFIVCPSGSCTLHIKEHLHNPDVDIQNHIRSSIYELTEFIVDILKINKLEALFPHKVGLHISCHGQRGLHLSSMSETMNTTFSKPEFLLNLVSGLELVKANKVDECCGFGGTFCVEEEAVSVKMGQDRINEHQSNDVEYITGGDSSCLMHLEGILKRNKSKIKTIHIAQILNSQI